MQLRPMIRRWWLSHTLVVPLARQTFTVGTPPPVCVRCGRPAVGALSFRFPQWSTAHYVLLFGLLSVATVIAVVGCALRAYAPVGASVALLVLALVAIRFYRPACRLECRLSLCRRHQRLARAEPWLFALGALLTIGGIGLGFQGERILGVAAILAVGTTLSKRAWRARFPIRVSWLGGDELRVSQGSPEYLLALKQRVEVVAPAARTPEDDVSARQIVREIDDMVAQDRASAAACRYREVTGVVWDKAHDIIDQWSMLSADYKVALIAAGRGHRREGAR